MKKMKKTNLHFGVTVIEVLTSMLVALIGVVGVLVLIPFSVQQAQLGLDQDAAGVVADNAVEDLRVYGFTQVDDNGSFNLRGIQVPLNPAATLTFPLEPPFITMPPYSGTANTPILDGNLTLPLGFYTTPLSSNAPSLIHLDPIAIANVGVPLVASLPGANNNPDFLTGSLPPLNVHPISGMPLDADNMPRTLNPLRMTVATATTNSLFGAPIPTINELLSVPEINRIFRTEDDLVTGDTNFSGAEVTDLELAQPVFDVSSQGNLVKRQSLGRISWSAVLQPIKTISQVSTSPTGTPATRYKVFVLVYGDRSVIPSDPDSLMLAAPVLRRMTSENPNNPMVFDPALSPPPHGGFDPAVNQIVLAPDIPVQGVFRDDWVMLINRRPLVAPGNNLPLTDEVVVIDAETDAPMLRRLTAEENSYRTQISFAKVNSVDNEDAMVAGDSSVINVDGGAFDFYYRDISGPNILRPDTGQPVFLDSDPMYTSATYVISLTNVLNVYERTITLESNSAWQ